MAKIVNISEIHPTLGFTEFDILEKYRKSFNESELGKLHSVFPFECMAKAAGLSDRRLGRRNRFSPSAKIALMVLKAYTGFSDRQLVEHLNGNIHYQIFCGIMIPPSLPITNFKIVSAIRNEIASRLDIDSFQELLASHWKPYLDNLHVCMTDATCYESHMRFPTDMKLLWESLEWLYRHICRHCRELGIRRPRNKYRNVAESYLSYCKKRKRRASRTRMLKRRMIKLLEKLLSGMGSIASTVLYSDIPRITISVFPSSERCLYKKRKCLKGGKSVTASSALTVIMYVPSSEARKPSPSSSVQRSIIYR
jgi:hypothetical protein